MIEFCTVKRMIVLVIVLGIVCIIFLGVENALTESHHKSLVGQDYLTDKAMCWKWENYSIKEECRVCSNFEKVSNHMPSCEATGYKELVYCEKSGEAFRSCPIPAWLERRNFWTFEAVTFVSGLVSWTAVFLRQKHLNRRMLERIQKQISSGV